jgi:prepilin-type N-terminal cleavage/methylation domain-containing protein/prepilin-type processing-associated H-X9-DG protein
MNERNAAMLRSKTRPSKDGFTLIELLVVIAIIAILAAMLLPSLSKAKSKATGAYCLGNEKQLTLAFMMYADDNNSFMPPTTYSNAVMYGGGYWYGPIPNIAAGISERDAINRVIEGFKRGPLWKYAANPGSYHCPGDMRYRRRVGDKWAYDSYSKADGMNGGMWEEGGQVHAIKKLTIVPEPVRAMVFIEEADSRNHNLGTWVINATSRGWVDPVAIFHNGSSSISFADGHAEPHKWVESTTIKQAAAAQSGSDTTFYWAKKTPIDRDWNWIEPRYKYSEWPRFMR